MISLQQIRQTFNESLASIYTAGEIHELFLIAIEEVLNLTRLDYALNIQIQIAPIAQQHIAEILDKLRQEIPIQQVLGKASFYGLNFTITPDTLIPRPETEELVNRIIRQYQDQKPLKILDIGTGSGCIAISLAKHLSSAKVHTVDISSKALEVAKQNAERIGVDVHFALVDITKWGSFFDETDSFDVIVSNPPYIRNSEKKQMSKNVLDFEPHTALFVDDNDPLLFYSCISDLAKKHLTPTGTLFFEINQYLGLETYALIEGKGFRQVELIKDINGADRMVVAKRP